MSRRPISLNLGPMAETAKETARRLRNLEGGFSLANSSVPGTLEIEPGAGIDFTEGHAIGLHLDDIPVDTTPPPVPNAPQLSLSMGAILVRATGPTMPRDFSHYNVETRPGTVGEWKVDTSPISDPNGAALLYGRPAGQLSVRLVAVDTSANSSAPGPAAVVTVVPIETAEQVRADYEAAQQQVNQQLEAFEGDLSVVDGRAAAAESAATAAEARATEANNRAMTRLANGNFEDGQAYWRFLAGASLTNEGHSGTQSALLPPGGRVIPESALPVVAGQIWEIQLYTRPLAEPTDAGVQVAFAKPGQEQTGPYYSGTRVTAPVGQWGASGAVRITIPEDMDQLSFWVVNPWAETVDFLVDDISLRDVTDVVRLEQAANAARVKAEAAEALAASVELAQGGIQDRLADAEKVLTDAGVEGAQNLATLDQRLTTAFQQADASTLGSAKSDATTKADNARTAAISAAATDATTKANNAKAAAEATANALPKVIHGTTAPSGTAPDGSTWEQHKGPGLATPVVARWTRVAGAWQSTPVDGQAVSNMDIGYLTSGGATIAEGVIEELYGRMIAVNEVFARRMFVGPGNSWTDPNFDMPGGYLPWAVVGKGIEKNGTGAQHGRYWEFLDIPVIPGESYYITAEVEALAGTIPALGVAMYGQRVTESGTYNGTAIMSNNKDVVAAGGTALMDGVYTVAADQYFIRPGFYTQATVASSVKVRVSNIRVVRRASSVLIEEGAVKASNITADESMTTKLFGAETGVIEYLTAVQPALFKAGLNSLGPNWLDGVLLKNKSVTAELINLITPALDGRRLRLDADGILLETTGGRPIMRFDQGGLRGYNTAGTETFAFDPVTGKLKAVNGEFSGTITGSDVTGSSFETPAVYTGIEWYRMEVKNAGVFLQRGSSSTGPWTTMASFTRSGIDTFNLTTKEIVSGTSGRMPIYGEVKFYGSILDAGDRQVGTGGWYNLTPLAPWTVNGGMTLRVRTEGSRVFMEGEVIGGGTNTNIASLPAEFRPSRTIKTKPVTYASADTTSDDWRVDILSNGFIRPAGWSGTYLNFDSVSWAI